MTKTSSGVYQLPNGTWGFRYAFWLDGKQKDIKRTKDENGKPFKTERAAAKAREAAIIQVQAELLQLVKPTKKRMTVTEVFKEYCETGRCGKAYGTTRKQDSLWKNHLSKKFGKRYVDDISVAEVVDYLSMLYYQEGRAYSYVESFLKMFYLIFGQAYSRNYLDVDTYNTLCVNKNTKIHKNNLLNINIETGNTAVDDFFKGNIELINNFMMVLAEEQIKAAFEQSEKEVTDLQSRISQGMREAKKNGTRIGITKGTTLITKKSIECKAIIQKHSKDFGGSLEDPDVIKLCGCSRNSYYKYKKEAKSN